MYDCYGPGASATIRIYSRYSCGEEANYGENINNESDNIIANENDDDENRRNRPRILKAEVENDNNKSYSPRG